MKIVALALLAGLAGCSSSSSSSSKATRDDLAHEIGRAVCAKYSTCFATEFRSSYKSVDDCFSYTYDRLPTEDRSSAELPCSREELDTCGSDYAGLTCPASSTDLTTTLPTSCDRCN